MPNPSRCTPRKEGLNSLEVNLQQIGKPGRSTQQNQKTFSDLENGASVFRNRIGGGFAGAAVWGLCESSRLKTFRASHATEFRVV
jgi:hypothetical protein